MNLLLFNLRTDADDDVLGFTTEWVNTLAMRCERVVVVTMSKGRLAVASNVEVFSIGKEKGWSELRRAVEFYRTLLRVLLTGRIEACFAHMTPLFAAMAWPVLRPLGIPIVLWYAHKSVTPVLRIATRLVDRVVTSSRTGFQIDTPKRRIIGQGIDTARFRISDPTDVGATGRPFTILSLGRLSPIKRVETLVEALAVLHRRRPGMPFRAEIVGGPTGAAGNEYAAGLEALVAARDLGHRVRFLGPKAFAEIHLLYQSADCFVNCGETDSVDKAVLEAMSCGVPVLTSNPAFRDVLPPDLAQRCLVPKGRPADLADRLLALMELPPSERRSFGEELRGVVVGSHGLPSLADRIVDELRLARGSR